MAKSKPTEAQIAFIDQNFETHDGRALSDATGLDVETCDELRGKAFIKASKAQSRNLGKLADGIVAMTPQLLGRTGGVNGIGPKMGEPTPEQQQQLAEQRAKYTTKAFPD